MSTSAAKQNRVRIGGSGYTVFTFAGQPITFCQQVAHTSPQFVGNGVSAIQPMDEPYVVEILTPAAAGMGQLVLNLFDLFGKGGAGVAGASKVWDRLGASVGGGLQAPFGNLSQSGVGNVSTVLPNVTSGNGPFTGMVDIVDIAIRQAQLDPTQMQITKYVRPLGVGGGSVTPYYETYVGCVITSVVDGEQIEVGTLEVLKQITVAYRYLTRNGQVSQAFRLRDAAL